MSGINFRRFRLVMQSLSWKTFDSLETLEWLEATCGGVGT